MPILSKKNIAIAIALLSHVGIFLGIFFTPNKDWFINATTINLFVAFLLLIFTQPTLNLHFFLFTIICFFIGFGVEIIGVNTSILFGNYSYGNVLGYKFFNVPILIGLFWFVTVYCCGVIMNYMYQWTQRKIGIDNTTSTKVKSISLIIDAALLATLFNYIIEPAAQKLGYWKWESGVVPFFNYTCRFFISALLLMIFNKFSFNKLNAFAIHLFIIQLLFFLAIRFYL